jgi:hypothetical protein
MFDLPQSFEDKVSLRARSHATQAFGTSQVSEVPDHVPTFETRIWKTFSEEASGAC